jgi:hypothetical protein
MGYVLPKGSSKSGANYSHKALTVDAFKGRRSANRADVKLPPPVKVPVAPTQSNPQKP